MGYCAGARVSFASSGLGVSIGIRTQPSPAPKSRLCGSPTRVKSLQFSLLPFVSLRISTWFQSDAPLPSRRSVWLGAGLIALAASAAWHNSFSGPFIFDDVPAIEQNQTIRHWSTALLPPNADGLTVSGRPLLNLSFALNYALSGSRVWSYHAFNLCIHVLAGLTLFGIVRRTLQLRSGQALAAKAGGEQGASGTNFEHRAPPPLHLTPYTSLFAAGEATSLALVVALLWTVHPLQTEAVTYVVQRAESLMGLFYLLTLYCFIRAVDCHALRDNRNERPSGSDGICHLTSDKLLGGSVAIWLTLSVLACLLGMACKEVMVSAPLIVFLHDRTFVAGSFGKAWRQRWRFYAGLAATWIFLAALVAGTSNRGGTAGFGIGVSLGQYLATQFEAITRYLRLSIWPHPLILDYGALWVQNAAAVVPYALLVGSVVAGTAVALRRRPVPGFLGAWFLAILAPTSLVPGNRQTIAEHRTYLALAPVIAFAVVGLPALRRRPRDQGSRTHALRIPVVPWSRALVFPALSLTVAFAWLTAVRNADYRSDLAIWRDNVAKRPQSAWAHHNLACVLLRQGAAAGALAEEQAALRLKPDLLEAAVGAANALTQLQRESEAVVYFQAALKIEPNHASAHESLGAIFARTGRLDQALEHYAAVVRIAPKQAPAHFNLAMVLTQLGRLNEAIAEYQTVLRLKPDTPAASYNLGAIYQQLGRVGEARAQFEQTLRWQPANAAAHNNLGNILARAGQLPEAVDHYEAALRSEPNDAVAHYNLGTALLQLQRPAEAAAQFEAALRIQPDFAPARETLNGLENHR